MNEFVSWCRHLLVSFLFHALTSLHPPSFHRNDFSTCSTHFSFILVQSPEMFSLRRAQTRMRTRRTYRARTRKWRRFSVSRGRAPRSTIGMYGERKTNARCPCTLPSTVETFGEEISSKEIAGLLKKKMMMMMMMMMMKNITSGKIISMK